MSASLPLRFAPNGTLVPAVEAFLTRMVGAYAAQIDPWIAMPDPGLRPNVAPMTGQIIVGPGPQNIFNPTGGPYNYTVSADVSLLDLGTGAFYSNGGRLVTGSSLINHGTIWSEGGVSTPIGSGTGWHRITNTGNIVSISQNASIAVGGGTLNNSGDIIAIATSPIAFAYAYQSDNPSNLGPSTGPIAVVNSGRIYAWSQEGSARGMSFLNDMVVENSGEIHARGFGTVDGIRFLDAGTLNNSGVITSISGGDIQIGPVTLPQEAFGVIALSNLNITNAQSGIIVSDYAVVTFGYLNLVNNGTIYGAIVAGLETGSPGPFLSEITNSGSIFGDIFFGDTADKYTISGQGRTSGTVYLGGGADVATGGTFADYLAGEAGDDILIGGDGDDILIGGAGRDILNGGEGFDIASYELATVGQYLVFGDGGGWRGEAIGDQLTSIEGLIGSRFNDILAIDNGNNYLSGLAGADELYGLAGDDVLVGGAGADYVNGGAGFDTASYENATTGVYVVFGDGASWNGDAAGDVLISIEDLIGSQFNDVLAVDDSINVLDGFGDDDVLLGLGGDDILLGGAGNDVIEGGKGADYIDGEDGNDTASYARATSGIYLALGDGGNWTGEASQDILVNIENVIGTQFNDILSMDDSNNSLTGGNGNDQLYGQGGDDLLSGGIGRDFLNGGTGNDTASYATSAAGVYVFLGDGGNWTEDAVGDVLASIENLEGSSFNDVLGLDDSDNRLSGGAGNDGLYGLGGNDVLDGGAGSDLLVGGNGTDIASYRSAASGIYLFVGDLGNASGDARGDVFSSIENVTGSSFNDIIGWDNLANTLDGGDGNDLLYGQGGDDILIGSGGDDILVGGAGRDQLNGGAGRDLVSYSTSTTPIYLYSGDFGNTNGDAIGDSYTSIEGVIGSNFDDIIGWSVGADWIDGGAGNDRLFGLAGGDILIGGAGNDIMTGGSGVDVFRYLGRGFGADVITDFTPGQDIIDFRGSGITGNEGIYLDPDGLRLAYSIDGVTDSIKFLGLTFGVGGSLFNSILY